MRMDHLLQGIAANIAEGTCARLDREKSYRHEKAIAMNRGADMDGLCTLAEGYLEGETLAKELSELRGEGPSIAEEAPTPFLSSMTETIASAETRESVAVDMESTTEELSIAELFSGKYDAENQW